MEILFHNDIININCVFQKNHLGNDVEFQLEYEKSSSLITGTVQYESYYMTDISPSPISDFV